jgi:hypothetical protein
VRFLTRVASFEAVGLPRPQEAVDVLVYPRPAGARFSLGAAPEALPAAEDIARVKAPAGA